MNGCDRKRFLQRLLLGLGLLTAAIGTGCEATSPASSRMRHQVELLGHVQSNIREEAYEQLLKDGAAAVPALVAALQRQDGTCWQKQQIIWCLRRMRAPEGVPALVRFSDCEGWFLVTDETANFPTADWDKPPSPVGRKYLALQAREAIGMIIDPTGKSTWGSRKFPFTSAKPGTEEYYDVLEKQKAYWRKVNSWYQEWREGYDPEQQPGFSEEASR